MSQLCNQCMHPKERGHTGEMCEGTRMSIPILFTEFGCRISLFHSTGEWIKKILHTYTMKYYLPRKEWNSVL